MRSTRYPDALVRAVAGFTLLEMLVVLAILGLLSIIALPPLRLNEGTRLREVVHALAADVRLTRQEAMRRAVPTAIVPADAAYLLQPSGRTKYLPPGVALAAAVAETRLVPDTESGIRFFPDGSSTGGILAVQQGSVEIHLTIRGFDGKVRLDER
jgi:general secretion pathway protein H